MDWKSEGHSWPNSEYSEFIKLNGMNWHVQRKGSGKNILLIHGTGATTHSVAELFNLLAKDHSVMALDLPGHGFASKMYDGGPTLERVSSGLEKLLKHLIFEPDLIVGHSAGAAVAVNLTSHGMINPKAIVSINGAFYPFPGFAGQMFPAAAKLLFVNPFMSHLFAFGAGSKSRVANLIDSTGSKLDDKGLQYYQRALQSADHIEGTLAMMANWELEPIADALAALEIPLLQIIGSKDGTIEPAASLKTDKLLKCGERQVFEGYGHLVHEEIPEEIAKSISQFFKNKTK